jgi:TonB family protein
MKFILSSLVLLVLFVPGFSHGLGDESCERLNSSVKKERLGQIKFISEIIPGLWDKLALTFEERKELESRKKADSACGYYINPGENSYNRLIEYVAVEISVARMGKTITSLSTGNKLTVEQKKIINAADLGSEINIKIRFSYKNESSGKTNCGKRIVDGNLVVKVLPETSAEFPGGFTKITEYLMENVMNKFTSLGMSEKVLRAKKLRQAVVTFIVNEEGKVIEAKISGTSADQQLDKLLLDAVSKMPEWKPAQNSKGLKIKQKFNIPLSIPVRDAC